MISTVTVSTVSTIISTISTISSSVTTVSTIAAVGMATALSVAATVTLISFLTTKEIVSVRTDGSSQRIGKFLNVAIVPLLMVFVAAVITLTIELL